MTTAAVIVSYNRKPLLEKCLNGLLAQTRMPDEIIVVDNGSTDGGTELVKNHFPSVTLIETGQNLGGAGGFAWGIEVAIAKGHTDAWIMDDDGEPEPEALEQLLAAQARADARPAFLASLVTRGGDLVNPGNVPVISPDPSRQVEAQRIGGVAIDSATFVGVLIDLKAAARTHLPFLDFFIWADDTEYTRRLSRKALGIMVPSSKIKHPLNKGDAKDIGPRLFYFVRNNLWLLKESEYSNMYRATRSIELVSHSLKRGLYAADKVGWFKAVIKGYGQVIFSRPDRHAAGDLIRSLPEQVTAALLNNERHINLRQQ